MTQKNRDIIQKEALDALKENNGGCVVLGTGVGKSKVAIDYIKQSKASNILITSPRTTLKDNWKNELEKWGIQRYSGENPCSYIYNKHKCFITIENIQTCYKWTKKQLENFDLIIADEAHTLVSEEYGKLIINAKKLRISIVGLTATPDNKKIEKKLFYQKHCPIVYTYLDGATDGIINKRKYIIYEHYLNDTFLTEVKVKNKSWFTGELKQYKYIESQINKGKAAIRGVLEIPDNNGEPVNYFGIASRWYFDRNLKDKDKKYAGMLYMRNIQARQSLLWNLNSTKAVAQRMSLTIQEQDEDSKILIFSSRTEQASNISKYCIHSKNKSEVNTKYLEHFNAGYIRQLGSCYSLTLGLNLINAKYGIMESYNGSDVQFKQKGGRFDRLHIKDNALLIIIVVKDTQGEVWFNNSIEFGEQDEVTVVNNMRDFNESLINYLN